MPALMVWIASSQHVLKLSWDKEKPASFNFTLRKRKKIAWKMTGKLGGLQILLMLLSPFELLD
jgi:hypothetical protein